MDEALLMDGLRRERLHLHEIPLCDFICLYGSKCCDVSHFKTIPLLERMDAHLLSLPICSEIHFCESIHDDAMLCILYTVTVRYYHWCTYMVVTRSSVDKVA